MHAVLKRETTLMLRFETATLRSQWQHFDAPAGRRYGYEIVVTVNVRGLLSRTSRWWGHQRNPM